MVELKISDKGDGKMEKNKRTVLQKAGTTLLTFTLAAGILAQPALAGRDHGKDTDGDDQFRQVSFTDGKENGKGVRKKSFFQDEGEAKWAIKSIIKLAGQGVFKGDGQGHFMPNRPITRAEAVVAAVRLMGKEEEAKSAGDVELLFKDAKSIDRKFGWAEGYIYVALKAGLFDSDMDQFQPEKPATREWVATLMVRALGWEDEALAKMNTSLPFKDARSISATAVGYVAVAVEKGLIKGFPNGTFQPNKPITRAEMATLLDRMDWMDEDVISGVQGVIYAVSPDRRSFEVRKANGDLVKVVLDSDSYLYLDGHLITASDLKPDLRVTVIYDKDGSVLLVDLRSDGVPGYVEDHFTGSIDEFSLPSLAAGTLKLDLGPVNQTFTLTKDTVVKTEGLLLNLSDLKVNQRAEIKVVGQVVTEIKVEGTVTTKEGTLVEVKAPTSAGSGYVKLSVGQDVYETYSFAPEFTIYEGNQAKSLADLTVGDLIRVKMFDQAVKRIEILSHLQVEYKGEIRSIFMVGTDAPGRMTIRLDNGRTLQLPLDPKAVVTIDGAVKGIGDLVVGEQVTLYVKDGTVVQIIG